MCTHSLTNSLVLYTYMLHTYTYTYVLTNRDGSDALKMTHTYTQAHKHTHTHTGRQADIARSLTSFSLNKIKIRLFLLTSLIISRELYFKITLTSRDTRTFFRV